MSARTDSAHLPGMTETPPDLPPETQPSFGGLTRVVKQQPVYGIYLPYRLDSASPRVPNLTGEMFVSVDDLAPYAGEDGWTDFGDAIFETDPAMRSAMLDNGLAKHAFSPNDGHLRRTPLFVEIWNALFADLPADVAPHGRLTRPTRGEVTP